MVRVSSILAVFGFASALVAYLPLFPYLDPVSRILFPAAFLLGLAAQRRSLSVPPWTVTVVSLLVFIAHLLRFTAANIIGPAVNLIVILLAVRLVAEKNGRTYLQIYALSLFGLAGLSLFSLTPLFFVYLLILLCLTAISLVLLTFLDADPDTVFTRSQLRQVVGVSSLMPLAALPLMVMFFFILPRTQVPLWEFLNRGGAKVTGFSEEVRPGSASFTAEVQTVAFRVDCERLPAELLYWRGIVFNSFENGAWKRVELGQGESPVLRGGRVVAQTIYPEPSGARYLFGLNLPYQVLGVRALLATDFVITGFPGSQRRQKYRVLSRITDSIPVRNGIDRRFYLGTQGQLSERVEALAGKLFIGTRTDADRLRAVVDYFRTKRFIYASSRLPVSQDPIGDFLLDSNRGNCEYFASGCALLLRAGGIPTRLVGGYYGGEYNEIGGYYVVTEDLAHVWVEAFLEGKGWVRIDPSSYARNFAGRQRGARGETWWRRAELFFDAVSYYWNLAVINYDLERQLSFATSGASRLRRLSLPKATGTAGLWKVFFAACLAGSVGFFILYRRRSEEERLLESFRRRLRQKGVELSPTVGLYEQVATLDDPLAKQFVEVYGAALYRDRRLTGEEINRLRRILRLMG